MTTLAELTRKTARLVTRTVIGSTTSAPGNGTQIVDTVNLVTFPNDNFNGGTVWIISGANAGRSRAVTDFETTPTCRLTCAAFPSNIASGVSFEAATSDFVEYRDLRQAVNNALMEVGMVISKDDTLEIIDDKLIYTLPSGVSHVLDIYTVTNLGEVDEYEEINNHWKEENGSLIFEKDREPNTLDGEVIRIKYEGFHADLIDDTDTLNTQIDPEYLIYLSARQAMRLSYKRFGKAGSDTIPEWLNEAIEEMQKHIKPNAQKPHIRIRPA